MNTFFDYLHYMQEGGVPQQQMAPQQQPSGGGEQEQIMQIIQMYAQIAQVDPRQIMQQLQKMPPQKQQEALQQMIQVVQQASQQQGGAPTEEQQMPMQKAGGQSGNPGTYADGYSGTFSGGNYFSNGGAFVPTYGEYAYGGPFSEIPAVFNQPVDRPNKAMYGMGMAGGGQMPQWLAERRFKAAGNEDMMSQYGYESGGTFKNASGQPVSPFDATHQIDEYMNKMRSSLHKAPFPLNGKGFQDGGIVVGQEMEATPEMIQKLKDGGYTFEYLD
jgi:hypothetical protein